MTPRAVRRAVATASLVCLLAACGSTVQQTAGGERLVGGGDGLSAGQDPGTAPGDLAPDGMAPSAVGATAAGSTSGAGGTAGSTSSSAAASAGASGVRSPGRAATTAAAPKVTGEVGPGVFSDKVRIGFSYVDTGSGTGGFLGKDVSVGNPKAQANAVRDYINAHGGVAGRPLELVAFGSPYANYINNAQAEYARVCTYFTQDQKVLAVGVYVPDENFLRCLASRDVVSVADGYPLDRKTFDDLSAYYYAPGAMSLDRGAETGVQGLVASGALPTDAKIGLLRYNTATYARSQASLERALAATGRRLTTTFEVDYSNTSQAVQDAGAAVLRFRQLGITHVMVLDNSGGITYAFMQQAESQQYRPYYALTTNNSPGALQRLAPPGQLEKATAVSWWWGDVGKNEAQMSPPAVPASKQLCLKIMRDAGVDLSGDAAQGSALITCDQLLFLKAVLDRAPSPSSGGMQQAADGLGTTYTSTLSYDTRMERGRHDGATITRLIRWDKGCSCFVYGGPGPTAR